MKTEDVLFGFVVWLVSFKKLTLNADTDSAKLLALVDEFCLANNKRADWADMPLYDYSKE